MGNLCSNGSVASNDMLRLSSREIESEINKERRRRSQEARLLFLGAGESGKTTLCKHALMLHSAWRPEEREHYRVIVRAALVQYMKLMVSLARRLDFPLQDESLGDLVAEQTYKLTCPEEAEVIHKLWQDPAIQRVFALRNKQVVAPDSSAVLFDRVCQIGQPDYLPSNDDCLRVRLRSLGIVEYHLQIKELFIRMVDVGGQRNERRKWIHCFSDIHAVLYCIALDDYCMLLTEDLRTNRLAESLRLFKDVLSIEILSPVPFIIFFNKVDLLSEKLPFCPLKDYCPNYQGSGNFDDVVEYIKKLYLDAVQPNRGVYPHVTNALDPKSVKFVFDVIKEMLIKNIIHSMGY
mmetsp:Transcript_18996/g.48317  ORF Transcript_18996/g.48317 Transcript_18996/m.48317 type:complete len:349 (-) Transcript_18996:834-1880(-)|eukprot:CAMPEP_0177643516 /NCGR_PEP_ID=MMETSP0447-20121125/8194_1 /TAXON_ID=0 /ORGANISM="Stygamoeba regulata, Strain BSH-02190019" /LENGTH=348 /DNA_ID=CAMNT_0019145811 /DNA_START=111 /DNA_END=1157 /DNA_ORIENTATION=-